MIHDVATHGGEFGSAKNNRSSGIVKGRSRVEIEVHIVDDERSKSSDKSLVVIGSRHIADMVSCIYQDLKII